MHLLCSTVTENMFSKVLFVLSTVLSFAFGIPIDAYGPSISLASPALSTSIIQHAAPAVVAHPAPAIVAHAAPAIVAHAAPAVAVAKVAVAEPYDPNPQYSFAYGVTDHSTGDSKQQQESLVNGVIHGSYSLAEPDGTIRKVTYTADKIHGFNAVVEKKGVAVQAVPAVAKVAVQAPVIAAVPKVAYTSHALSAPTISLGGHY